MGEVFAPVEGPVRAKRQEEQALGEEACLPPAAAEASMRCVVQQVAQGALTIADQDEGDGDDDDPPDHHRAESREDEQPIADGCCERPP